MAGANPLLLLTALLTVSGFAETGWAAPSCPSAALLTQRSLTEALGAWRDGERSAESLRELYQLVQAHLKIQGVAYRETTDSGSNEPVLEILPDRLNASRLNQWASSLWEKHHVRFLYDLKSISERGSRARYVRPKKDAPGLILLPSESILDANSLNSSLAHEMLHSITIWHLGRKDEFAFYGRVRTVEPETQIPFSGPLKPGKTTKSYAGYFAFDEINTHFGQATFLWRKIRQGDSSPATLAFARLRTRRGLRLANQTRTLIQAVLVQLQGPDALAPSYYKQGGHIHARLLPIVEGVKLEIKIPLVRSTHTKSSTNRQELLDQLTLLETWSERRAAEFARRLR